MSKLYNVETLILASIRVNAKSWREARDIVQNNINPNELKSIAMVDGKPILASLSIEDIVEVFRINDDGAYMREIEESDYDMEILHDYDPELEGPF